MQGMKYECANCGAECEEDDIQCANCGELLEGWEPENDDAPDDLEDGDEIETTI